MELEHMRRILAERGMRWTRQGDEYWVDEHGAIECRADWWEPDTDWAQCGLVIEAIRAKGWHCSVHDGPDGIAATCVRFDGKGSVYIPAGGSTECEARMLAVARALEATDA